MNAPQALPFLLAATLCGGGAVAQPPDTRATPKPAVVPSVRESFHVYLLMGQSNMVGRDVRGLGVGQVDEPRILSLDADGRWVVARDPIHAQIGKIPVGVGPGLPFARELLKTEPAGTIGLVPCAVGGTPLRRWVKGGDLYEHAVARARIAAKSGVLEGVLWHQGESDTERKEDADTYEVRLTQMLKDLRADLGRPELPVVVGQLGEFLTPEKYPSVETVRAALRHVPAVLPHVAYADSAGLGDKGDHLHFSADAQREFGARYAREMRALQQAPPSPSPTAIDLWPDGKMPGTGAREPEAEVPARGDGYHRITNISRPTLTLFPAPRGGASAPAMIVCPGGGYSYVVYDKEGTEIAAWLNGHGISALVLKYRVPNNRSGALQDIQRALSLARSRAAEWNLDPRRLGVLGFSAGGNLAAKASTNFDKRAYPAVDEVDHRSCRPDFAVLVYPAYLDDRSGRLSPDLNLKVQIPPTLIVHTEDDRAFVAGSRLYDAALTEAKVPHEFKLYPTGGHGYALHCAGAAKAWPEDAFGVVAAHRHPIEDGAMNENVSGEKSPSALIDGRIDELNDWRGTMLARVRRLIHEADPEIVEEWKWRGVPTWYHDGIVCTGETYKAVVKMTFARGASLPDPAGLFNSSLEGNVRRAIDIRENEELNEDALRQLIREAVALNVAGKKPRRS